MLPVNLVRPITQKCLLLEKWENTCKEVHADNFDNAADLPSTPVLAQMLKDISKGML